MPSTKIISIIGAILLVTTFGIIFWVDHQWDQDHRNYYAAGLFQGANFVLYQMQDCSRLGLSVEDFNARMQAWQDSIKSRVSVEKVPDPFQP